MATNLTSKYRRSGCAKDPVREAVEFFVDAIMLAAVPVVLFNVVMILRYMYS